MRETAKGGDYAPLTIENGVVVLRVRGGSRISMFSRNRGNYLKMLEEQGGTAERAAAEARLADGNQLHHLIPDGVAQRAPLVQEALKRLKNYTIDRGSNLLDMPVVENEAG